MAGWFAFQMPRGPWSSLDESQAQCPNPIKLKKKKPVNAHSLLIWFVGASCSSSGHQILFPLWASKRGKVEIPRDFFPRLGQNKTSWSCFPISSSQICPARGIWDNSPIHFLPQNSHTHTPVVNTTSPKKGKTQNRVILWGISKLYLELNTIDPR